jgi:hypothetical protein
MNEYEPTRRWWNDYREAARAADSHRIEIYLRSLAPTGTHGAFHEILDRIDGLAAAGTVDDLTVAIWGRRICQDEVFTETNAGRQLMDTITQFEAWGSEYDADPAPFFEQREVCSSITDAEFSVVVPPELCLAVRVDSVLTGVFPTEIDDEPYSVRDFLDAAEREFEDVTPMAEK